MRIAKSIIAEREERWGVEGASAKRKTSEQENKKRGTSGQDQGLLGTNNTTRIRAWIRTRTLIGIASYHNGQKYDAWIPGASESGKGEKLEVATSQDHTAVQTILSS